MKIYVLENGIVFAGKGWEIKQKLKEAQEKYVLVSEWVETVHHSSPSPIQVKRVK